MMYKIIIYISNIHKLSFSLILINYFLLITTMKNVFNMLNSIQSRIVLILIINICISLFDVQLYQEYSITNI